VLPEQIAPARHRENVYAEPGHILMLQPATFTVASTVLDVENAGHNTLSTTSNNERP
jgi:hypothetical protein